MREVAYTREKPHPPSTVDPCPVNGVHHWLVEQERVAGMVIGRCKECGNPWPWERGRLEPIASVIPRSYQKDGAEYLARL